MSGSILIGNSRYRAGDSAKYCEDTNRENTNRYLAKVKLIPYAILKRVLLRLVRTYSNDENEEERTYGTSFLSYIASDPAYKQKYLHAVKLVYDGAKQPKLRTEEFAGLRDRILILHPEKDIFIKEGQEKLTALLADVGTEAITPARKRCSWRHTRRCWQPRRSRCRCRDIDD